MPLPEPGWVYVLTNPTLPGECKIGGTGRDTTRRTAELFREYGVSAPFVVRSKHAVFDWRAVESSVHRMLDDCRIPRSERFTCTPKHARRVVRQAALAYEKPWAVTVWLRRLLHPPRPQRLSNGWRRSRRGSGDGLIVLAVLVVIAAPVVILKPDMPSWLPASMIRAAVLLERLHR